MKKIAIKPLDKLFSLYVRTKANWTCQRCGQQFIPPTNGLHCAHMVGRRAHNTRWFEFNALALCYGCHSYIDSHHKEKKELFEKIYGKKRLKEVRDRYNNPRMRVNKQLIRDELKQKLLEL